MARPRKTIEQIKIFQINFRITLNEQIQLESFAKNYGLNVVEYVRRRALQKQLPKFVMSGLERDLLIELSRIGNNINQMSKRVNQGNPNLKGIEDEFECKLVDFYIDDIDYREVKTDNNCIILYKNNLKIIDFLKEIANNIKKSGNNLELFFYRTGVGVDLKIDYDIESLKKIDFVIPDDLLPKLLEKGINQENIFTLDSGDTEIIDGIKVEAVPAYNTNKPFHPKENNWLGYIIEIKGVRYYIAGDTDITEENKKVKCDVAFVPVGGTYTMDFKEAAQLINIIKPKFAIPVHYGSVVGSKQDATDFIKLLYPTIKGINLINQ